MVGLHRGAALWASALIAALAAVWAGADPSGDPLKLILRLPDLEAVLEQPGWVVRVPPEPLFDEPEGSRTARSIYQNVRTDRLLLVTLYRFEGEETAAAFFSQTRNGGEVLEEAPSERARLALRLEHAEGELRVDEVKIAVEAGEQQRFLRFRWGQFVSQLKLDAARVTSERDLTDENLIRLARRQFEILVEGHP